MTPRPTTAIQFNNMSDYLMIIDWMRSCGHTTSEECRYSTPEMSIQTATGTESARPGDWIVKHNDGNFHVRHSHILITPKTCPCLNESRYCGVCDGGLAVCARCGAAEIELEEPCNPSNCGD